MGENFFKDLAAALDTTLKTISHWETGYSEPSIDFVLRDPSRPFRMTEAKG